MPRGGVRVIPKAVLFQPLTQPSGQGLLVLTPSWVN